MKRLLINIANVLYNSVFIWCALPILFSPLIIVFSDNIKSTIEMFIHLYLIINLFLWGIVLTFSTE